MPDKITVIFEPDGVRAHVEPGSTILDAARTAGIALNTPCGGEGICGNCRVILSKGAAPRTSSEEELLSEEELAQGLRLACQTKLEGDAVISVPKTTHAFEQKVLVGGLDIDVPLEPYIGKHVVSAAEPLMEDVRADADRVSEVLERAGFASDIDPGALGNLPGVLREGGFDLVAVSRGRCVSGFEVPGATDGLFGVAVDVGTTSVVAMLVDLATGEQRALATRTNPQVSFGDDVVSRINYSAEPGGLEQLSGAIRRCLNDMIAECVAKAGISADAVYEVVLAGNTTMNHLALGVDPTYLGVAPYVAALRAGVNLGPAQMDLEISAHGNVYTMPNITGFVGGDIVAAILSSGIAHAQRVKLLIDIGTNGEIVLGKSGRLICCSCAAGPAFEGARIRYGMRAAAGAIEQVGGNDVITIQTIDNAKARGICGSGLIDAVAVLRTAGVVDETGRMIDAGERDEVPSHFARRISCGEDGCQFMLASPDESEVAEGVHLTQQDIRQVQLAKGAISAGITTMLAHYGITLDDVDEILISGAFGNYIQKDAAKRVGLIPDVENERIRLIGNGSGAGARMALVNAPMREQAERISRECTYVELAGRSDFQAAFMDAMLFSPILTRA